MKNTVLVAEINDLAKQMLEKANLGEWSDLSFLIAKRDELLEKSNLNDFEQEDIQQFIKHNQQLVDVCSHERSFVETELRKLRKTQAAHTAYISDGQARDHG